MYRSVASDRLWVHYRMSHSSEEEECRDDGDDGMIVDHDHVAKRRIRKLMLAWITEGRLIFRNELDVYPGRGLN